MRMSFVDGQLHLDLHGFGELRQLGHPADARAAHPDFRALDQAGGIIEDDR